MYRGVGGHSHAALIRNISEAKLEDGNEKEQRKAQTHKKPKNRKEDFFLLFRRATGSVAPWSAYPGSIDCPHSHAAAIVRESNQGSEQKEESRLVTLQPR